jgi:hypothetical protein
VEDGTALTSFIAAPGYKADAAVTAQAATESSK